MELNKQNWTKSDVLKFQTYLKTFARSKQKQEWEQNIVQTKLPCLAIGSSQTKFLSSQILKGNYLSFIKHMHIECLQNTLILGNLICKIKDFDLFKTHLTSLVLQCDNWASVDNLKFNVNNKNEEKFFALALEYTNSPFPFVRRTGIRILFKFISNPKYIDQIFNVLNKFEDETHYYVNMVNAWIICECFIKQRTKTLNFLKHNQLNAFTINKAISKCRDSFRVCPEDKQMLLSFKKTI